MNSQINRHFFNLFFLILIFSSIQLFNTNTYYSHNQNNLNTIKFDLSYFQQINYSDDLEIDTSFDLQKRKIFDIDIINSANIQDIIDSYISKEVITSSDIYFSNNLITLSNPRAPPLF